MVVFAQQGVDFLADGGAGIIYRDAVVVFTVQFDVEEGACGLGCGLSGCFLGGLLGGRFRG